MKSFLHGWSRKCGLLTLAVAIAMVFVWMRSHSMADQIQYRSDAHHVQVIGTEPDGLIFVTLRDVDGVLTISRLFESRKQDRALTGLVNELSVSWKGNFAGFRYGHFSGLDSPTANGPEPKSSHAGRGGTTGGRAGVGGATEATDELSMPISDPVVVTQVFVVPYWPITLAATLFAAFFIFRGTKSDSSRRSPKTAKLESHE